MHGPIYRSIREPLRTGLSTNALWLAEDDGLIKCWELGREMAENQPELAAHAMRGELPVLAWKGGVAQKLENPEKFGTFRYLATWQGLRHEDLNINPTSEMSLICSRTEVKVTYTSDSKKYSPS